MSRKLFVVFGLIAVGAISYGVRRQRAAGLGTTAVLNGNAPLPAPEFSLPTLAGQPLTLAAYRGKVVLLDFWATWCDPCREEIPHLVELQEKYRGQGLQVLGISMDDGPEPVRDFYQQFKLNYPVVMGTAKTGELYGGVLGLPITFLIGRDGRIYHKHIGATDSAILEREVVSLLQE